MKKKLNSYGQQLIPPLISDSRISLTLKSYGFLICIFLMQSC